MHNDVIARLLLTQRGLDLVNAVVEHRTLNLPDPATPITVRCRAARAVYMRNYTQCIYNALHNCMQNNMQSTIYH